MREHAHIHTTYIHTKTNMKASNEDGINLAVCYSQD